MLSCRPTQCLKWFEKAGGSLSPLTRFPYTLPQSTTQLPPELGGLAKSWGAEPPHPSPLTLALGLHTTTVVQLERMAVEMVVCVCACVWPVFDEVWTRHADSRGDVRQRRRTAGRRVPLRRPATSSEADVWHGLVRAHLVPHNLVTTSTYAHTHRTSFCLQTNSMTSNSETMTLEPAWKYVVDYSPQRYWLHTKVRLKSQVNSFLKRAFKYGFCSILFTIEAIAEDADIDLFCKMKKPIIALILYYPGWNLVHTTSHPKGTHMNSLGVIRSCIKSHLYPVASFAICNFCLCFV